MQQVRGYSDNTWHSGWGGGGTGQCHQMLHGGGRELAKASGEIFFSLFIGLVSDYFHAYF
jgi:hypothetical protein